MSLALYRKYRPGRFAEVIGQDHVTVPLMRAIDSGRVHHAYLFSGPRGCGKTSSARILARSLNCAEGPTSNPCEKCQSCLDLAPNGPGSMDVIEMDAATHGLVDDARDLREKAHFAPVSGRFKIYIVDEAHQLGPGAANALLKIIEEPPPHVKFVFATTAPDKLLGTIRSRTHHYPFRLVPSRTLVAHLERLCAQEDVTAEPAALSLVARAGAGSVRDALSVLGQLIAGAGPEGLTYGMANALLGFTDAALLDEVVEAVADRNGAVLFQALDRVSESGHDPRRFLTDLLERFRDLLVLLAAPEAVASGLIDAPDDQAQRLASQAGRFGPHDVVRLADVVDEGITAMKGATPTRLQLELVCARLLLPGAEDSVRGVQARLDRLERRLSFGGVPAEPAPPSPVASPPAAAAPPAAGPAASSRPARASGGSVAGSVSVPAADSAAVPPAAASAAPATGSSGNPPAATARAAAPAGVAPAGTAGPGVVAAGTGSTGGATGPQLADVRRMWPEVLVRLSELKRTAWSFVAHQTSVWAVEDGLLVLATKNPQLRQTLDSREDFQSLLGQALRDVLGVEWGIKAVVDPAAHPARQEQQAQPDGSRARPDDPTIDDTAGSHHDLLARELGATVISETPD